MFWSARSKMLSCLAFAAGYASCNCSPLNVMCWLILSFDFFNGFLALLLFGNGLAFLEDLPLIWVAGVSPLLVLLVLTPRVFLYYCLWLVNMLRYCWSFFSRLKTFIFSYWRVGSNYWDFLTSFWTIYPTSSALWPGVLPSTSTSDESASSQAIANLLMSSWFSRKLSLYIKQFENQSSISLSNSSCKLLSSC